MIKIFPILICSALLCACDKLDPANSVNSPQIEDFTALSQEQRAALEEVISIFEELSSLKEDEVAKWMQDRGIETEEDLFKSKNLLEDVIPDEALIEVFGQHAEGGSRAAMTLLGHVYASGHGVAKDEQRAFEWYLKSAEAGFIMAYDEVAKAYYWGKGVEQDRTQALVWRKKLAEYGDSGAQTDVGLQYAQGEGVEQDYEEANRWFRIAAKNSRSVMALMRLSWAYEEGLGVPIDFKEAEKYLLKMHAAQREASGDREAYTHEHLSLCTRAYEAHKKGINVDKNLDKAISWLTKAAKLGDTCSQVDLGEIHRNGDGVPIDYDEALKWFQKAHKEGSSVASFYLAFAYSNGQGVKMDKAMAAKLYIEGAKAGLTSSQINLAILYRDGQGVPKDDSEAFKWFEKASEQGEKIAQIHLAKAYSNGHGTIKDIVLAYKWANLAAAQGMEQAGDLRDLLAKSMTKEQIADAQKLSREWNETRTKP